jgi:hypothetical protein
MTIAGPGLYVQNMFVDVYDATQLAIDLSLATHKIALITNTYTPNYDTDIGWTNTNEVAGTGWVTGGIALSAAAVGGTSTSPTNTTSSGTYKYAMNDIAVSATTLASARAARIYADALAGDNLIVLVNFGADFSTTAGTFGIQWAGTGVFTIDGVP